MSILEPQDPGWTSCPQDDAPVLKDEKIKLTFYQDHTLLFDILKESGFYLKTFIFSIKDL